jgi:hypothetical protein
MSLFYVFLETSNQLVNMLDIFGLRWALKEWVGCLKTWNGFLQVPSLLWDLAKMQHALCSAMVHIHPCESFQCYSEQAMCGVEVPYDQEYAMLLKALWTANLFRNLNACSRKTVVHWETQTMAFRDFWEWFQFITSLYPPITLRI